MQSLKRSIGWAAALAAVVGVVFGLVIATAVPAGAATGVAFLKSGVDARAALLGHAVTSSVDDASACFWNPAGLAAAGRPELLLTHTESFADLRHEYFAVTQPLGELGPLGGAATAGLSFNGIWTDNLEGYDEAANPTGSFGYSAYEAAVALGSEVRWGLTIGGSLSYLREDIGNYSATGWTGGVGVQWKPEVWGAGGAPVSLGLAVRNIGPGMTYISEEFELPLTVQGGVTWTHRRPGRANSVRIAAEVRHVRDEGSAFLAGAEYGFLDLLSLGLGYQTAHDTRDLSVGLGAHRGGFDLHWAYVPFSEDLGDEHRFSLRVGL